VPDTGLGSLVDCSVVATSFGRLGVGCLDIKRSLSG
jgi:hypothetical protein